MQKWNWIGNGKASSKASTVFKGTARGGSRRHRSSVGPLLGSATTAMMAVVVVVAMVAVVVVVVLAAAVGVAVVVVGVV